LSFTVLQKSRILHRFQTLDRALLVQNSGAELDAMTLLRELMLADLERGLEIVRGGHAVVPAWRVLAPDGDFFIHTRFDPDKPEQRERAFALVPRFMAWKLATGFLFTAETWLGPERTRSGEEAVLGVSRHDRIAAIRLIRHTPSLSFGPPEWLAADALDDNFRLLPSGQSTVMAEEAASCVSSCSCEAGNTERDDGLSNDQKHYDTGRFPTGRIGANHN
jgi:hypothetical protein